MLIMIMMFRERLNTDSWVSMILYLYCCLERFEFWETFVSPQSEHKIHNNWRHCTQKQSFKILAWINLFMEGLEQLIFK